MSEVARIASKKQAAIFAVQVVLGGFSLVGMYWMFAPNPLGLVEADGWLGGFAWYGDIDEDGILYALKICESPSSETCSWFSVHPNLSLHRSEVWTTGWIYFTHAMGVIVGVEGRLSQ